MLRGLLIYWKTSDFRGASLRKSEVTKTIGQPPASTRLGWIEE